MFFRGGFHTFCGGEGDIGQTKCGKFHNLFFFEGFPYLVVESAPKRFLLETDGDFNVEKQEIDENAATRGMRGWMDRMNKKMIRDGKQAFGQEKRNRFLGPFCKAFSFCPNKLLL